jgi:hypothetical protein
MKLKELLRAIPQSTDIKVYLDGIYEEKKLITDYTEYKENEVLIVAPSYNEDDVICIALKKSDILDDMEKEYLSYVIKPFRNRIEFIKKIKSFKYYIYIKLKDDDDMMFPNLPNKKMYKNMKENQPYKLEELGL